MVDFKTYQKATEAVKSGKAPEDVLGGLMDIIDEYEKNHQEGFSPGAFDVPTAAQAAAPKPEIPAGATDVPTAATMASREGEARALNAPVAKALKLREGMSGAHLTQEPPKPWEAQGLYKPEQYDETIPTASHRKDAEFVAPPEYIPPPKAQPLDFWGALNHAKQLLPMHAGEGFGGEAVHFTEPPIQQFRRDMAPVYGAKVNQIDEYSPEYHEYSDKLWKDIYDQAVKEGRPVIRDHYAKPKTLGGKLDVALNEHVLGPLTAAAVGVSEATPGNLPVRAAAALGSDKENLNRLAETSPVAHDVGFGVGASSPLSTGNLAVKAFAPELGAATFLRRAAGNAGAGYIAGGAQQLGTDLERGNTSGALGRANLAGLYGIPLAVGGGEAVAALGRAGESLRKNSPLGEAEKIGATTSTLGGIKPGARMEALREEAAAAQIGPSHEPDVETMLAGKLEKPLTEEGRRLRATEKERVGKTLEEFHGVNAHDLQSPEKYVGSLSELHRKLTDRAGNPLPENGPLANQLRHKISELVDVQFVPRTKTQEDIEFGQRLSNRQAEEEARAQELHEPMSDPFATHTEAESTTPGGRAVQGEKTIPDQVTPVTLNDLEFPPGTTMPPPAEMRTRLRGPGLSKLKEIQKTTPSAFIVPSTKQAVKEGFISPEEARQVGDGFDIVVVPKRFSPGEFHQIVAGVNEANKEGARIPPDPRLTEGTSLAIRQDRDLFKGQSPGIPKDLSYTVKDEQGNPIPLKGYSAFEAKSSDELAALKRKLNLAGVGENPPELLPGSPYRGFVGNARGYGSKGRPGEVDQALREVASSAEEHGHPGVTKTLDEIKYARAVAELEKAAKITHMFRGYHGAVNPVERMSAMGLRLRLDPMLQFLGPKLGGLGAAGATVTQREGRGTLPPTADQATIDKISQLLGFGP